MKLLTLFATLAFSATLAQAKTVSIDSTTSQVKWNGEKKVPGSSHTGVVKIKEGTINLNENNELTGGSIVIDMKSIEDQDLSGKWKTKLEKHLNSEDFFHTEKHTEASFKITKVEKTRSNIYKVTGNLTMRGTTHLETFELAVEKKRAKKSSFMVASGELEVDRTKYGITYNSQGNAIKKAIKLAKDKIIKDKFKLSIELKTQKI